MKFIKVFSIGTVLTLNLVNLPNAAATNTITFTGNITDATCNVSLEYGGKTVGTDGTGTIPLSEISSGLLKDPGTTAGPALFYIVAKDCVVGEGPSAKSKIAATFTSANADNLGNLNNLDPVATGGAKNVQFKLRDSKSADIIVNDPNQSTSTATTDIDTTAGGVTKIPYSVEYYSAAGGATQGTVSSSVNYELIYK